MVVLAAASYSHTWMRADFVFIIVVTGLWRPPRIGCKRRRRGIWIHYEVGDLRPFALRIVGSGCSVG